MKRYVFDGNEYTNIKTVTAVANGKCLGMEAMLRHKKNVTLPRSFKKYADCKEAFERWECTRRKKGQGKQDFLLEGSRRLTDYIEVRSEYVRACKDYYELRKQYREAKELLRYFRSQLAEVQNA